MTNIKTTNSLAQVIQDLSYQYDSGGNITSITDNVNTADQTFGYDALNRLTSANAPGTYGNKTYAYDTIGNITSKDGITYLYGENGDGPHAVTSGSDGSTFSYDANGNMLTMNKGGVAWAYIYDTENRLAEVKKNLQTQAQYEYDGDGGRTKKISYTWVGGNPTTETTRYAGSLYEESSSQTTNHIFMGDSRIASITNGILKYYHTDHLGGTNLMTDSVGAVKQIVEYDPWGKTVRDTITGTPDQQAWHLFTSKQFDKESELYYYGARYYNPVIGRFITPDEIVQDATNPQALNRYSYTSNNPVNRTDPSGHSWKKFWKKWGDFISPLGRAIVTGDWQNFGWQMLNLAGVVIGMTTFNPVLTWTSALSYASRATSQIGDNASREISRVLGYAAIAVGAVGTVMEIRKMFNGNATLSDPATAQGGNEEALSAQAYQSLSSGEIGDAELMAMYNNVQTGVTEKVAIANALVKGAESTVSFVDEAGLIDVTFQDMFTVGTLLQGGGALVKGIATARNFGGSFLSLSSRAGFVRIAGGKSAFQLNRLIQQSSNIPKSILRFDSGKEMLHVHFSDKTALYANGVWKHGVRELTGKEKAFLTDVAGFNLK